MNNFFFQTRGAVREIFDILADYHVWVVFYCFRKNALAFSTYIVASHFTSIPDLGSYDRIGLLGKPREVKGVGGCFAASYFNSSFVSCVFPFEFR